MRSVYATMKKDHPEAYSKRGDFQISAKLLRDQITSGARTVLLVLLAASALVFVVACSNVANLILARTVRREGELAVRTALGASKGALRRMLLAESVLLCGGGAALGVLSAQPMVEVLARYTSRFSVRALDLTVDSSLLVGRRGARHLSPQPILAFVPRLPSRHVRSIAPLERRRSDNRQQKPSAHVRCNANRRVVRAAGRRECGCHYAPRAAKDADRYGFAPCPRHQCSRRILRQDTPASCRFLQGSHTSH